MLWVSVHTRKVFFIVNLTRLKYVVALGLGEQGTE